MVIIAVIAQDSLHATLGQAGLASGIYIIGTLLARLFMGKLLELIGRKQVLRYGALFYLFNDCCVCICQVWAFFIWSVFKWVWLREPFRQRPTQLLPPISLKNKKGRDQLLWVE